VAIESAHFFGNTAVVIDTNDGDDDVTVAGIGAAAANANLTIGAGAEAADVIAVNGTATMSGTATLEAAMINLNANVTNAVTGSTASVVNVAAPGQVQDGIDVAADGAVVNVAAGTYAKIFMSTSPSPCSAPTRRSTPTPAAACRKPC